MEATLTRPTKKQRKLLAKMKPPLPNMVGVVVRVEDGSTRLWCNADVPRVWPHRHVDHPIAPLAAGACARCRGAYTGLMQANRPNGDGLWERREVLCDDCRIEIAAMIALELQAQGIALGCTCTLDASTKGDRRGEYDLRRQIRLEKSAAFYGTNTHRRR